ncbi:MAG: type II toxin-antitoxin system VapC family toxin [Akkermansiaceae bacterium]|jgi:predicted nucleic acid-binding protein|nr:type II toxin-antitoxin system VapC family toxin [Akkermansiaceae bacterium]MBJ7394854.1 type II toxin-antitoxin system VapC family toxin [Akkermansiaceae bacterium]
MKPVLVDTCVWVRHFRQRNALLAAMLEDGEVWSHPIVVGELTMGTLKNRQQTIFDLSQLSRPPLASFSETRQMVESRKLWGRGIQWNDARILASSILGEIPLWTFDLRLQLIARELEIAFEG